MDSNVQDKLLLKVVVFNHWHRIRRPDMRICVEPLLRIQNGEEVRGSNYGLAECLPLNVF